jgi:hypothetical protein
MKKIMIITMTFVMAVIFGAMLAAYIGTLESVYAQTKATNSNNNTTITGVGSASDLENITRGNTSLSQNRGDIASPTIGLAGGLEKEQINDTEGNMTAADKTVGQNATSTTNGGGGGSSNATTTTTANNTSENQTSSENKTENPLSNVPIIGDLFK